MHSCSVSKRLGGFIKYWAKSLFSNDEPLHDVYAFHERNAGNDWMYSFLLKNVFQIYWIRG